MCAGRVVRRAILFSIAGALVACRVSPPPSGESPLAPPPVSAEVITVDVREPALFAQAHEPGSINLQLGYGQLRLRARDLFGGNPLRLVAADESQRAAAVKIAESVGCVVRDSAVFEPSTGLAGRLPVMTAAELRTRLGQPDPPLVLDVRTVKELASGHIAGAVYLYPNALHSALAHLRLDGDYAVICEEGWRSSTVASAMARDGFTNVSNVLDGMKAWRAAGYPMLTSQDEADFLLAP